MIRSFLPLGVALLGATCVLAQTPPPECSLEKKCPENAPCCSQYGQCGVGAFCLGGCDPRMSFSLDSCVPAPVCKDKVYKMDSLDRIKNMNEYLGDPETADWVGQGEPRLHNGHVILTMPPRSPGTVLATSTYMWYGDVKAKVKTSRGAGVVSAFILYGDVKDEIDFEWVGTRLDHVETNYYYQGIPDYVNGGNISVDDTYENWHEYEIRWGPDKTEWLVDGVVGRTLERKDTWDAKLNQWKYPQTPSRVQISIWPGGQDINPEGTIEWAGGPIDWNSEDIKKFGYYFTSFGEITVNCYNADKPPGTNKRKSYYYNDIRSTNDTVVDSDKPTILKSMRATGRDMDYVPDGEEVDDGVQSIPGGSLPAPHVPGGGASGTGGAAAGGGCNGVDWAQNCQAPGGGGGGNGSGSARGVDRTLGASAFAVIIGIVGLLLI